MYKRGDLVWAKMKGFPPWPGIITAPPPELKKQPAKKSTLYHCIYFFGSQNYSWIEAHKLERYYKGAGANAKRSSALREAVNAIDAYIDSGEGASNFDITPEEDVFDKLVNESMGSTTLSSSPSHSSLFPNGMVIDSDEIDSVVSYNSSIEENVTEVSEETTKENGRDKSTQDVDNESTHAQPIVTNFPEIIDVDLESDGNEVANPFPIVVIDEDDSTKVYNNGLGSKSSTSSDISPAVPSAASSPAQSSASASGSTSQTSLISMPNFKSSNKLIVPHSGGKRKHIQQVVRARPFRHIPKPRVLVERTPIPVEAESPRSLSTPSTSTEPSTSGTKRSNTSNSQESATKGKKKRKNYSDADTTTPLCHPHTHSSARRGPAAHLFDRPPTILRPDTPPLDLFSISQIMIDKHIVPSDLRFGFLGLGVMGSAMVKNLLNSGHRVIVWNRSPEKSREFAKVGAEMAVTPQDVAAAADITFSCVSGPRAAKDMVFGNCGILSEINSEKSYVEMTNIDKETSKDINDAITSRGGRFLEAQIQGSKQEADEGTLVILTSGDRSLYNECQSCFEAFGRSSFYLGELGNASKMNLVIQMIAGITLAGLAEGLALADRCGLQLEDILEVIGMTSLKCPWILEKGKCIKNCSFPTSLALNYMQTDLKLGLKLGDELEQPLPLAAVTNEVYKHTKRLGYGEHDVSAVYIRSRF